MASAFVVIAFLTISGCTNFAALRDLRTDQDNAKDDDESANIPANINGTFLTCSFLNTEANAQSESMGCNLMDQQNGRITNTNQIGSWDSSLSDPNAEEYQKANVKIEAEDNNNQQWDAIYTFSASNNNILDNSIILNSDITFKFLTGEKITSRVNLILGQMQAKRYLRFAVRSISSYDPSRPVARLNAVELLLNGEWWQMSAIPNIDDQGDGEFELAPGFQVILINRKTLAKKGLAQIDQTNAQAIKLILNATRDPVDHVHNIFSSYDLESREQAITDLGSWSDMSNSIFNNNDGSNPDNNALSGYFYVDLDLEAPTNIQGIRFNLGEKISDLNVSGAPDQMHFEVSNDGSNWAFVAGSDFTANELIDLVNFTWSN